MANFCGVVLSNFLSIVIRVFHLVLSCKWAVEIVMPALECSPGKVWWDVWIQLQDRGLESHIGSMGFWYRVYKSPTTTASFYHVVLPSFLSIGIRGFHHVLNCKRAVEIVMPTLQCSLGTNLSAAKWDEMFGFNCKIRDLNPTLEVWDSGIGLESPVSNYNC